MPKIEFLGRPVWVGGRKKRPARPKAGDTYYSTCAKDCIRSDGKLDKGCVYIRRWDSTAPERCAVRTKPASRKPATRKATKKSAPRKRRMTAAESRWAALYPELQGARRPRRRTARRRISRR